MKFKFLSNPLQLHKKLFPNKKKTPLKKRILRGLLYSFIGFILVMIGLFAWFSKDLPSPGKIRNVAQIASTQLFDRNGNPLYAVSGDQKRIIIEQEAFKDPAYDTLKHATIAIEDRDFYNHKGFNVKSLLRAVFSDIKSGDTSQGGSTITQQYVKNALLTPQKSFTRKIKELILSIELEFIYSKDEILALYLNEIPYGGNVYGAEAASERYFAKPLKELTLAQTATLVALPQSPTRLSPYGPRLELLINRKNIILDQMAKQGYITEEQAVAAKAEAPLKRSDFTDPRENITAAHFVFYAKDKLVDILGGDDLAERMVEEGGLKVTTTLDLEYQKAAEESIRDASSLKKAGATNAALVATDPNKGEVLAMVGSLDYFDTANDGNYNTAIADRQPGSSFKPIVYATAFKRPDFSPSRIIYDLATDFNGYQPKNYDGTSHGPLTIRKALGNSYNIPAVKTLALVGIKDALTTAHDIGITTLNNDPNTYGLALTLGAGEVKLVDLVTAYGVFANKGVLRPTTTILKIEDSKGKILYDAEKDREDKAVLDPQIAYEISSILSDIDAKRPAFNGVLNYFTFNGYQVASKTGTTNLNRDAWSMGYTPNLSVGVWAGNNDNTPMRGGSTIAATPIWNDFMKKVINKRPKEDFVRPEGITELTVEYFSNKIATEFSQRTTRDIFASWQVPKEKDSTNVVLRVCTSNGLLATENTPLALTEERVFRFLHSERPDDPKWEGPVIQWANANGYNTPPPTEKCDITAVKPNISITSPVNGSTVNGQFKIKVEGTAQFDIKTVEVFIDGISIGQGTTLPYEISYNANNLSNASHTITAKVADINNSTSEVNSIIAVNKDTTPPGVATSITLTSSGGKIIVSWKNPTDTDFVSMNVYYSQTSGQLGTKAATKTNTPGSEDTYSINGLQTGKVYYITLRSVDSSNNENPNLTQNPIMLN